MRVIAFLIIVVVLIGGGYYWWQHFSTDGSIYLNGKERLDLFMFDIIPTYKLTECGVEFSIPEDYPTIPAYTQATIEFRLFKNPDYLAGLRKARGWHRLKEGGWQLEGDFSRDLVGMIDHEVCWGFFDQQSSNSILACEYITDSRYLFRVLNQQGEMEKPLMYEYEERQYPDENVYIYSLPRLEPGAYIVTGWELVFIIVE